jgi:hypothetical protein
MDDYRAGRLGALLVDEGERVAELNRAPVDAWISSLAQGAKFESLMFRLGKRHSDRGCH